MISSPEVDSYRWARLVHLEDSTEIGLIMQGMRDWVRQKEPKRFSEFGTQRYWSKPDLTFEEIE